MKSKLFERMLLLVIFAVLGTVLGIGLSNYMVLLGVW